MVATLTLHTLLLSYSPCSGAYTARAEDNQYCFQYCFAGDNLSVFIDRLRHRDCSCDSVMPCVQTHQAHDRRLQSDRSRTDPSVLARILSQLVCLVARLFNA